MAKRKPESEDDLDNYKKLKNNIFEAFSEKWFIKSIQVLILLSTLVILIGSAYDVPQGKANGSYWIICLTFIITNGFSYLFGTKSK
jgi:hypothetical protein